MSRKKLMESGVLIPKKQPYLTGSKLVAVIRRLPRMMHGPIKECAYIK